MHIMMLSLSGRVWPACTPHYKSGNYVHEHRFENTDVVTGAGIGRKNKDMLLLKLMREFKIPIHFFETEHKYSELIQPPCDVKATFALLKRTYEMISIHQGWVEGALESVHDSLTKEWLRD